MAKIDDLLAEARKGSADAMMSIGRAYADGVVVPHNYSEAVTWFERAVRLGNSDALLELAVAYEYGLGYDRNNDEAFILYMRAAAHAKRQLPFAIRGHVLTKNICSNEYKGMLALAEAGYAHAMYRMGKANERNVYVEGNDLRLQILSAKWMGQAAELGYPLAIVSYSGMRLKGDGHLMSQEEMAKWMLKAYEYDKKTAKSISSFYSERFGVKPDKQTEEKWEKLWNEQHVDRLKWQAISGDSSSAKELASRYLSGENGLGKDCVEAVKWCEQSATAGLSYSNLAISGIYLKGIGVPRDTVKGLEYFSKEFQGYGYAYWQESPDPFSKAMLLMAEGHLDGYDDKALFEWLQRLTISFDKKYAQGNSFNYYFNDLKDVSAEKINWRKKRISDVAELQYKALKRRAEAGSAEAQYWYAYTFKRYKGRAGTSLKWILKSAEQGYPLAQFVAGLYYGFGEGAPIDTKQCLKWLTSASRQGLHKAQLDLIRILSGNCLREGGYPQKFDPADVVDLVEAYAWHLIATESGYDNDTDSFHKNHIKDLTSEDLAKAFSRARELKAEINAIKHKS